MIRRVATWVRVSTADQSVVAQHDEVERFAAARGWTVVERFAEEAVSGAASGRRVVDAILASARRHRWDAVVVFRGDRAFRSAGLGALFLDELLNTGRHFVSVSDGLDTSTPAGAFIAKVIMLVAEWERIGIRERQRAGIAAAKRRGVQLGRPRRPVDVGAARELLSRGNSSRAAARALGVSARTLTRALERAEVAHKVAPETGPEVPANGGPEGGTQP